MNDSPTFNRLRASYTQFFPVDWLKIHKGCRPKAGEQADCPQAIGVQVKGGAIMGEAPPYEAFCMGGSNSIRGWYDCDMAVSTAFSELTIEYRFPLISIFSGEVFMDAGTDFGTQKDVPGKPGLLLGKDGSGVSLGTGVIVTTPVGPIRLEVASEGLHFRLLALQSGSGLEVLVTQLASGLLRCLDAGGGDITLWYRPPQWC